MFVNEYYFEQTFGQMFIVYCKTNIKNDMGINSITVCG